ncbi:unannotated protein [freshwater metagenome]|uniref:Unannotated protein n=1 Tax=freshwater metagenome TaxID=449393 RepID=A0A6J6P3B0_9ZZZZ
MIATLLPVIFVLLAKILPASKRCSTSSTRTAPLALIAASITRSSVASAPVCEAAACAPATDRPDFKTAVGFAEAILASADTSARDSAYIKIASTLVSVANSIATSSAVTSASFPVVTTTPIGKLRSTARE